MKRLFRTSKAGTIDPLPPPPQQPPQQQQQFPIHTSQPLPPLPGQQPLPPNGQPAQKLVKKTMTDMLGGNGGHPHHSHEHHHRPRQGSVTPFPLDAGRQTPPPNAQPPAQAHSRGKKDKSSISSPPSLLEIQQMQAMAEGTEKDHRRDQWVSSQRQPPPPPPQAIIPPPRRLYESSSSPDGWSIVSGGAQSPSNASTPIATQPPLFLPPGARPPSPQVTPNTPTRPTYPSSLGHSQTSVISNPYEMDLAQSTPRVGRDRGYSSASGSVRGSDHESSNHGHPTSPLSSMPIPKPAQPIGTRSPLSNAYASPISPDNGPQYASTNPNPAHVFPSAPTPFSPITETMSAIRIEGPSPEVETPRDAGKEKKKFWGMDWSKKDKEKGGKKELERPSNEEPRRSAEWRPDERGSSTGHTEDDSHRGRVLGLDIGRFTQHGPAHPATTDSVTTAIQILCAHPNPPIASIYEVCDRINHSTSSESVGKEAAHALRKQFKHGNDQERKSAANLWLLMMKNVTARGFRGYAVNKKFLSVLEPILLAPPTKPIVSPSTHNIITQVLADLTYTFGQDKGGEALPEFWKKIKLPQESDMGIPLPADFSAFTPENFYAHREPGSFDSGALPSVPSSFAGSRRPSSPNALGPNDRSVPPPLPHRVASPLHMGGPGYANLPNHSDDIRRLVEECTAARESARVLAEALVFTRPHELDSKPIIREFYRKCFLAHESLTNQIDWAQAEAYQSRERAIMDASAAGYAPAPVSTPEEQALGTLFEAHGQLAEALKQHDDMERLAVDDAEMREVRERSKKETRMDRNQGAYDTGGNFLAPGANGGNTGSSSRSPSPTPHTRLPAEMSSPRRTDQAMPIPRPFSTADSRSRTPSPDRYPHPKISQSPGRTASPLGTSLPKTRVPRPLPDPFNRGQTTSSQSLSSAQKDGTTQASRSGTGSTGEYGSAHMDQDDDDPPPPVKPSRKALGKRRLVEDPDNHFNPDDMFLTGTKESSASSEESITADEVFFAKPTTYVYDAYQEKLDQESAANSRAMSFADLNRLGGGSGGSSGAGRRSVEAR